MQPTSERVELGRRIHELRKPKYNQTELAERLTEVLGKKIDPTTVTRMEKGTRPTTMDEVLALSKVLSVNPAALLPSERAIDKLASEMLIEAQFRDSEVARLQNELDQAQIISGYVRAVRSSAKTVADYESSGDTASMVAALNTLAWVMDKHGGMFLEIPLVQILKDLGLENADRIGNEAAKHGRPFHYIVETAFKLGMPDAWAEFLAYSESLDNDS